MEIDGEFEKELKDFLSKNYDPQWGKSVRLTISQEHRDPFYNLVFGNLSIGAKLTHKLKTERITIPFDMMRSIMDSENNQSLFANIDENYIFIPNLKQVWEQIRTETPINARAILDRKDIPQEKRIAILGLSLPEHLLSLIMPGLIFAFSLYFLVFILHLNRLYIKHPIVPCGSRSNHAWP